MTVSGWELVLIKMVVLPVLKNISNILAKEVKKTPNEWDDVVVGTFQTVIAFLDDPTFATKIIKGK